MKCCVIDDEPLAAALISSYIDRLPFLTAGGVYHSATEAVKAVTTENFDLVFLDINMPMLSGTEFARIVPPTTKVIFITAYDNHAVEAFRVGAVDYLLKPVSFEEFSTAVNRVMERSGLPSSGTVAPEQPRRDLFVKNGHRYDRIVIDNLLYVEGLKDYVKLHTSDGNTSVTLSSMLTIENLLPEDRFIRVHRSFLVNTDAIAAIERTRLILTDGSEIPIGDSYRTAIADYVASRS
ncbi:MAG: LytTR family DNA-binding domain-containing protein [Muribaculaceae bacterium]|nr:LytTR family DNA-binding domain-containing protein [Muribaculaceae bacterium]